MLEFSCREDFVNTTKMTREREKSLKALAGLMNTRHQNPYPLSEPLLDCLDLVLTKEEVDFLLEMGTEPYNYEQAVSRTSMSEETFRDFFDGILRKGYAWPHDTPDEEQWYKLPGFMLGAFEVYLADGRETQEKKEFARRLDALLKSFGELNKFPTRNFFNAQVKKSKPQQSIMIQRNTPSSEARGQTIAVGKILDAEPARVYPTKTVEALIEKQVDIQSIAVIHCFCRQYHKMVDRACSFDHPQQSCIAFGSLARFAVQYGTGRYLTKPEALDLVHELQSKGAVHQVFHQDEDINNPEIAICNCCWDCCGVLGSYNRGIIPLNLHAFFEAQLPDESLCNGCATCSDYCPVQAIAIEEDLCRIDREKCIGCGQCELQCPQEAIRMIENERTVFLPLVKKSQARIREA